MLSIKNIVVSVENLKLFVLAAVSLHTWHCNSQVCAGIYMLNAIMMMNMGRKKIDLQTNGKFQWSLQEMNEIKA